MAPEFKTEDFVGRYEAPYLGNPRRYRQNLQEVVSVWGEAPSTLMLPCLETDFAVPPEFFLL